MSNLILNWRFGAWHLQVLRPSDWGRSSQSIIRWNRNGYHAPGGTGRSLPGWTPFAFYEGRRYLLVPVAIVALVVMAIA